MCPEQGPCPTPLDPDLRHQPPGCRGAAISRSQAQSLWYFAVSASAAPKLSVCFFSVKSLIILLVGKKLLKTAHNLSLGSDLVSFILIRHKFLALMSGDSSHRSLGFRRWWSGRGSLVGRSPWGRTESDTTEATQRRRQQTPSGFAAGLRCSPESKARELQPHRLLQ